MVTAEAKVLVEPSARQCEAGVPPGYKQTDVGLIPEDWDTLKLGDICEFQNGVNADAKAYGAGVLFANVLEVITNPHLTAADIPGRIRLPAEKVRDYQVRRGDILFNRTSETLEEVGLSSVYLDDTEIVFGGFVIRARPVSNVLDPTYCGYAWRQQAVRRQLIAKGQGAVRANIGQSELSKVIVPSPPRSEQIAVAEALHDLDGLVSSLERLLTKKRQITQGAMRDLLTARNRLPGFNGAWSTKRIGEIAAASNENNSASQNLPVLTCSKHLGFVESLTYFKNQVFSRDTSGYKIIRRNQIGYPSNHIEEGSIGLQDLYDVALVSPIYVVFSVFPDVSGYFLHRLLKLDAYRHRFAAATSASVDRRGSLRWPAFSQVEVALPPKDEQDAIVLMLSDLEAEVSEVSKKVTKARQVKQAMMQELLTGRIRLV